MKKFVAPLILLTLFAGVFSGCRSSSISTGLKIELAAITRAADGDVQVTWRMVNPNIVSYLLAESSHRIYLNGTLVGSTVSRDPVGVPAQQAVERTVRLKPAGGGADRILSDAIAAGSANYRLESAVIFRLFGESVDKSNLASSGTVPVTGK